MPWDPFVPAGDGDFDDDGDVDLGDYAAFESWQPGSGQTMVPGCGPADLDYDNDGDLADHAAFQAAFTGP